MKEAGYLLMVFLQVLSCMVLKRMSPEGIVLRALWNADDLHHDCEFHLG